MFISEFCKCSLFKNSFLFAVKRHGQFLGVVCYRNTIDLLWTIRALKTPTGTKLGGLQ